MEVKVLYRFFCYGLRTSGKLHELEKYRKDLVLVYGKTTLEEKIYFQVQTTTFYGNFNNM